MDGVGMMGWADIPSARAMGMWLHRDQVDKAGEPYALHLETVAALTDKLCKHLQVQSSFHEQMVCAAWLHDSVEDGHATLDEIRRFQGDAVAEYVECVTRDKNESYAEFIANIATYGAHCYVLKVADIMSNLAPSRMSRLEGKDQARLTKKYTSALGVLIAAHPKVIGL